MNKKEKILELERTMNRLTRDLEDIRRIVPILVTRERFDRNIDKLNSLITLLGYEYKQELAKEGWVKIKK